MNYIDDEYKDVVIDNDAIVNTEPQELPTEPQNIPQGKKPELNPNPGYGEDGETKPAIKTDLEEGESGTPVIENTAPQEQPEKVFNGEVVFNEEPVIKGKKLTDYIDSEGGVTQEELSQALATKQDVLEDAQEGSAVKIIGLDSEGNVVQDDIPEGIVVDETIIEDSPNAVAGGAVYDALQEVDAELETKANTTDLENGTLVVAKSLTAKDLENVSDESGTYQDSAFISQGTGTDNNTSSVDTGNLAKQIEKQGNTVCINQLVQNGNFANTSSWTTTDASLVVNNNVATITASASGGSIRNNISLITGHKYLIFATLSSNLQLRIRDSINSQNVYFNYNELPAVLSSNYPYNQLYIRNNEDSDFTAGTAKNVMIIDLNKWFNGNIPQDVLDNPSHFSWYQNYGDYIAYNTGTLVDSDGQYLLCTGRNLFAGNNTSSAQYIGHYYIQDSSQNYNKTSNNSFNCYRVPVIPNRPFMLSRSDGSNLSSYAIKRYVDKDYNLIGGDETGYNARYGVFTPPAGTRYIEFSTSLSVADVIDIQLYYSPEQGGEGYLDNGTPIHYPYEEPKVYDTGAEELKSAGSVKDSKAPDGTITRRIGSIDLSTINDWTYNSSSPFLCWYSNALTSLIKGAVNSSTKANIFCNNFETLAQTDFTSDTTKNGIFVSTQSSSTKSVFVRNGSSTTSPTGTLYYELAAPTTEQGTSFAENIEINDYGIMYWLDSDNNLVDIPQGVKVFYPAWYAGFIDSLFARTSGDASDVVKQSELSAVDTKHDALYDIVKENLGGTLRHQLIVQCAAVSETVDFANTKWVDISTLSFTYESEGAVFRATLSDTKTPGNNTISHLICPLYKTLPPKYSSTFPTTANMTIFYTADESGSLQRIYIKNTSYTDVTAFKAAMKGILLAYEKAS